MTKKLKFTLITLLLAIVACLGIATVYAKYTTSKPIGDGNFNLSITGSLKGEAFAVAYGRIDQDMEEIYIDKLEFRRGTKDDINEWRGKNGVCAVYEGIEGDTFSAQNAWLSIDYWNDVTEIRFVDKIRPVNLSYWFSGAWYIEEIIGLDKLDTSNATDMSWMFYDCNVLTNLDVSHFNTEKVKTMSNMFNNCYEFTSIDVSNFDTKNVTSMEGMFSMCSSLTSIDVSNFDTSNVTTMWIMFSGCSSLTSIDVTNFDTKNVTSMQAMFSGCSLLTSIDVTNFDTSKVITMWSMFNGCSSLTSIDVSNFNTSDVTTMQMMFQNCRNLTYLDISNFNTSSVKDMREMFSGMTTLETIIVSKNFKTDNVTQSANMFADCSALKGANDTTLETTGNVVDKTHARIDGLNGELGYFTCKHTFVDGVCSTCGYNESGTGEIPDYNMENLPDNFFSNVDLSGEYIPEGAEVSTIIIDGVLKQENEYAFDKESGAYYNHAVAASTMYRDILLIGNSYETLEYYGDIMDIEGNILGEGSGVGDILSEFLETNVEYIAVAGIAGFMVLDYQEDYGELTVRFDINNLPVEVDEKVAIIISFMNIAEDGTYYWNNHFFEGIGIENDGEGVGKVEFKIPDATMVMGTSEMPTVISVLKADNPDM